jgi:hypothetical protein
VDDHNAGKELTRAADETGNQKKISARARTSDSVSMWVIKACGGVDARLDLHSYPPTI